MDYISLCGIAVGLAMDAFAVSITNGACTRKVTVRFALKLAACFGFFQLIMPLVGWLVGKAGENIISAVDHWVALLLLSYIGLDMIRESHRKKIKGGACCALREGLPAKRLLAQAVATSIDALATGIILPSAVGASTTFLMAVSVLTIGLITFFICFTGVYIGRKFGVVIAGHAETVGGIVLIAIGVKIFMDHMFFH